jgi:hypothetical protein
VIWKHAILPALSSFLAVTILFHAGFFDFVRHAAATGVQGTLTTPVSLGSVLVAFVTWNVLVCLYIGGRRLEREKQERLEQQRRAKQYWAEHPEAWQRMQEESAARAADSERSWQDLPW